MHKMRVCTALRVRNFLLRYLNSSYVEWLQLCLAQKAYASAVFVSSLSKFVQFKNGAQAKL